MFNTNGMDSFFRDHQQQLARIESIRRRLAARFHEADDAINGVLLAAVCGFPCLLFGPPGVAKSRLIRDFCRHAGLATTDNAEERRYFEYLLTQFTEPTELFGAFRLEIDPKDGQQRLVRVETGMLHNCTVAFLDEVFNGSSAILNSLLALINEGVFHDRGAVRQSKLSFVFGATNHPPEGDALAAVFDRFVIRTYMGNVHAGADDFRRYLAQAQQTQRAIPQDEVFETLLDDMTMITGGFDTREQSGLAEASLFDWETDVAEDCLENIAYIVALAGERRLGTFSNRRLYQLMRALCMQRLMRAAREGTGGTWDLAFEDYRIIWTHFLDIPRPLTGDILSSMESLPNMPMAAAGRA